jgi:hypothetical protein
MTIAVCLIALVSVLGLIFVFENLFYQEEQQQ